MTRALIPDPDDEPAISRVWRAALAHPDAPGLIPPGATEVILDVLRDGAWQ
jgi:hypothetical protein